ncbi:MAG TPA: segregation/condensation protein A [Gammaproteobacteria bacterium]|nr:segregation/condensation protein A [Gammaproteobacteria bacterium]HCK91631.1 segregation/condensation protein A [Gammaproteobacteria bacterium]
MEVDASEPAKQPIAIVGGEALDDLPDDLYIPPQALQVFLESFQGPLDLLLYLIRKQNIDILDIPVAKITTQYVEYVQLMQHLNLELAGEYLVMAAILGEIKSRCLLPVQPKEDDPEADPRAELIRRLQAYEQIQKAAEDIDKLPRYERDFFPTHVALPSIEVEELLPDVKLNDILKAFQQVLKRASLFEHHSIQKEQLSTRERMSKVLEMIQEHQFLPFVNLFKLEEGRAGVVVTFLAILELVKESLLEVIQADTLGVIYVSAKKQIDASITITASEFD